MATYILGDIQGCYDQLQQLLVLIHYRPTEDRLCFVGDLINRGPKSLQTLRFIKGLPNTTLVLGNHDLHLLALGYDLVEWHNTKTLDEILNADDKIELLDWLRQQPLTYIDQSLRFFLVHAGLPPQWSINESIQYANEINIQLRGDHFQTFLMQMHGNEPTEWQDDLHGMERYRYIINALTRIRYCDQFGRLDLINKGNTSSDSEQFKPWFYWRKQEDIDIIFGHWAALQGQCNAPGYFALDTGCVWGGKLTALRVEDKKLFAIGCK